MKKRTEGGIITSKKEWETVSEKWLQRTAEERLTAIEMLRLQYIEMFGKSYKVDLTVFGKRE